MGRFILKLDEQKIAKTQKTKTTTERQKQKRLGSTLPKHASDGCTQTWSLP